MINFMKSKIKSLKIEELLSGEIKFTNESTINGSLPPSGIPYVMIGANTYAIAVHWPDAFLSVVLAQEWCHLALTDDWYSGVGTVELDLAECVNLRTMRELRRILEL